MKCGFQKIICASKAPTSFSRKSLLVIGSPKFRDTINMIFSLIFLNIRQMKIFLITLLLFLNSTYTFGQNTIISGLLIDSINLETIPFVEVQLFRNDTIKYTEKSNLDGVFKFTGIEPGDYRIGFTSKEYEAKTISIYAPQNKFEKELKILLIPCRQITIRECNVCGKSDKVIGVKKDLIVNYSFPSRRVEKKYRKKIIKQGYLTHMEEGRVFLIDINDIQKKEQIMKCEPCCKLLFCERDKIIF